MPILFKRKIKLTIGETVINGLDMSFVVERALDKDPNTCAIEIYNLGPSNRKILQEAKDVFVSLEVGYLGLEDEEELSLIYKGNLKDVSSHLDGSDWITTIKTQDGKKAGQARFNKSFASGTKFRDMAKQLIEESIKSAGVDIGDALKKLEAGDYLGFALESINGSALSGGSSNELDKLLKSMGLSGSIQDNELQITNINEAAGQEIVLLHVNSGLLGSPEPKNNGIIEVKALLQPGITPGKKVNIVSKSTDEVVGIEYLVKKTKYTGSNFTEDWFVEFEGKQIDG